jgi:DNA invertase Pin-like site-specific DNA recombinase
MTAAVYIRVSSPKGQKTDSQRAELEAWAKRQRLKRTSSGLKPAKPESTSSGPPSRRCTRAIFAGGIDTVIVWKLEGLARNLKDGINVLADWCQRGIRVVSVTQQIDLSGPVGQMIAGVLFGVAAIELHSKERQAMGIADAKKRGVKQRTVHNNLRASR